MGRELKFKAWDVEQARMISPSHVAVAPDNGKFCPLSISGEGLTITHNNPKFTLLQFTGVKDCKGNEIYDGDILKIHVGSENCPLAKVVWDELCGAWGLGDELLSEMNHARDEVVGNIYENPELLAD